MAGVSNALWSGISRTNGTGARANITFTGSRITLFYSLDPTRGNWTAYIDTINQGPFSSYAQETRRQVAKTWTVPSGTHRLEVRATGGGNLDVDAFAVDIATVGDGSYDNPHAQIRYIGNWSHLTGVADTYQHTLSWSNVIGSSFRFTFEGDIITYVYSTASNRGKAAVTIDGAVKDYIDMYSPTTVRNQSKTFTGLGPGTHVINIQVTNQNHDLSSDYFVDVDMLGVTTGCC